ncbi:MAG: hypothetical protein ABI566_00385 [Pseudolysinimonas sp.]
MASNGKRSAWGDSTSWIFGMLVGLAIGISLGVAMDNIAVGIAIGAGIGVAFAIAFGQSKKSQSGQRDIDEHTQP